MSQSVSLVVVGLHVHAWAALRPSSLHEMSAATGRRYAAFQPGLTRYQLLYIASDEIATHSCAPARCRWQPITPALLQSPSPSTRWWKASASWMWQSQYSQVCVRDAELLQVAMESAVFLQEPILEPAVEPESGEEPAVHRCGQHIRIVGTAARRGAEDAAHLCRDLGPCDPPPDIERRGVGDGAAEELRVFERQLDRAVASHRQAPDHPSLPRRNRVECAIHLSIAHSELRRKHP
jgi:hypothetical protein